MMPTQWSMPHWWAREAMGAILGPHHSIDTLHWCHCSMHVMNLEGWQSTLQKSRLVNTKHLVHWGWIVIECIYWLHQ